MCVCICYIQLSSSSTVPYVGNEAFQRKLDHQMSLHANVPKVFCAVVSNVAQAIGKAQGF